MDMYIDCHKSFALWINRISGFRGTQLEDDKNSVEMNSLVFVFAVSLFTASAPLRGISGGLTNWVNFSPKLEAL